MKFGIMPVLWILISLLSTAACANPGTAIQEAGAMVKTAYFSLKIPEGWIMPQPVKTQPKDGISAVFATKQGNMAVTINIFPATIPAKELAAQTMAQMRKSGLRVSEPVEKDGLWHLALDGKAHGGAWFGSNGSLCAATIIFGDKLENAAKLLQAIQEKGKSILPKTAIY